MYLCYPLVQQVVQCANSDLLKHQTGPLEVISQTHCQQLQQLWVEQLATHTHTYTEQKIHYQLQGSVIIHQADSNNVQQSLHQCILGSPTAV